MGKAAVSPESVNYKVSEKSPSMIYTKGAAHSTEFDRTVVSILLLRQIIRNDYKSFIQDQPAPIRLSKKSFQQMRRLFLKVLSGNSNGKLKDIRLEALDALISFMAIHDLGKSKLFADILQGVFKTPSKDHDQLLLEGMQIEPVLTPSYQRLSTDFKNMILRGIQADFNFGQFAQGENLAGSLKGLIGLDNRSFDFYLSHFILDVAGVQGHAFPAGSKVMIEPVFKGFYLGEKYITKLFEGSSPKSVYRDYLVDMGRNLSFELKNEEDFAIMRLALMARSNQAGQVRVIEKAFNSLSPKQKKYLVLELNKSGIERDRATLIYYSPALLANLISFHKKANPANALELAVREGIHIFEKVFQLGNEHRKNQAGEDILILNIALLAEQALKDPSILLTATFRLNAPENPTYSDVSF